MLSLAAVTVAGSSGACKWENREEGGEGFNSCSAGRLDTLIMWLSVTGGNRRVVIRIFNCRNQIYLDTAIHRYIVIQIIDRSHFLPAVYYNLTICPPDTWGVFCLFKSATIFFPSLLNTFQPANLSQFYHEELKTHFPMIPSSLNQIYNNNNIAHQRGPRPFSSRFFNKYAQIFGSTAHLWVFWRSALICTDVRAGLLFWEKWKKKT